MATLYALAGEPFVTELTGAPAGITDWEIRVYEAWEGSGSDQVGDPFTSPIDEVEVGDTGDVVYTASPIAPTPPEAAAVDVNGRVWYTVVWESGGESSDPDILLVGPLPATAGLFASLTDLAVMMGKANAGELSAAQATQGTLLLTIASGLITEAVGRDAEWAVELDPVPAMLRAVCVTAAKRVMDNATGARSESETLGQYSHSVSYTDGAHGVMLSDAEVRLCRRAVHGRLSASSRPGAIVDRIRATVGGEPAIGPLVMDAELDEAT